METFYQKVILITGAASGIGRELAFQLAGHGATVIATDVNEAGVEAVADEVRRRGGKADYYRLNVTDYHAVRMLIKLIKSEYEHLDYVFCNAHVELDGEVRNIPVENWERLLNVNLNGAIYTATEAYKIMMNQGSGHIITTAAPASDGSEPVAYQLTREALISFSRALQDKAKETGVRVSAFCPSYETNPAFEPFLSVEVPKEELFGLDQYQKIPVETVVDQLLKSVAANRELITMPLYTKLIAWMTRFSSPLMRTIAMPDSPGYKSVRKVTIQPDRSI
ncbi:SDR family NAD(P)-dependent oxidoreductase [Tellurirhabdus bombi]|uniref:SDR family NAD(P)-dependent oxidoreductase n=1 Tax=Tellurirhabdus bombi TaxID=2907205 RepID=UPI001F2BF3C6|nr:SDR family NAD(P)-dependent oxidoreductase [Tellurirhabdus bombi]